MRLIQTNPMSQGRPWIDGRDAARQLASGELGARLVAAARMAAASAGAPAPTDRRDASGVRVRP
jgi:hypothetical protein